MVGEGKAIGTGYIRNDVSNNISDGNVINASDLDGEFDAIEAAFNASTGHTHDGTSAEGAPIVVIGPTQEWVVDGAALRPKLDDTYDIGASTAEVRNMWVDGTANIDSLVADTADINGGSVDGTVIGAAVPAAITGTTITATTGFVGALTGSVNGNADTATLATQATALSTNRTFSITGDVTAAAVNFNGTGNVVLNATIDPDLAGIAALSWGNNEAPFYNAGAWQKYTVSGYSRSLLVATDSASARTTLGATTTGNSLFTAADAAAGRTALELGTISTQAANSVAVTGGTINGTSIGQTTPNLGTFTQLRVTTDNYPVLRFTDTVGTPTGHNVFDVAYDNGAFVFNVVTNAGTFVEQAYSVTTSTAGALRHAWKQANAEVMVLGGPGLADFGKLRTRDHIPTQDLSWTLGESGARWVSVWALNGAIQTSDEREKTDVLDVSEAEKRVGLAVKGLIKSYRWKDDPSKKHFGAMAQQVIAAFEAEGLDWREYGVITGGEDDPESEKGYKPYGVSYSSLLALVVASL